MSQFPGRRPTIHTDDRTLRAALAPVQARRNSPRRLKGLAVTARVRLALITVALGIGLLPASSSGATDSLLSRATQVFGPPLNPQHMVFSLKGNWVIWLIADRYGDIIEADVGPRSSYVVEFPNAEKQSGQEFMSREEYEETIHRISKLEDVGQLRETHGRPEASSFGPINVDSFGQAFVERVVATSDKDRVAKFNVYFLQRKGVSPEEIAVSPSPSMVCLVALWYYVSSDEVHKIRLGYWQEIKIAGPAMRGRVGCARTTPVYDSNGFTVEQPQNETIVLEEPFRVSKLAGQVHDSGDSPIEFANVEFLRVGTKHVIRALRNL